MSLIRPGVSMIEIDEITEYLNEDRVISKDTKSVAGVASEKTAVSALDESGEPVIATDRLGVEIPARNTVENSLMLGGIEASMYLNKEEAELLNRFAKNISSIYAEQIKQMKEELYNTKAELERRGYIKDSGLLSGMFDNFNEDMLKLNTDSASLTANLITPSNFTIHVDNASIFSEGDYVAVVSGVDNPFENETFAADTTKCYVSKVMEVTAGSIRIDIPVPPMNKETTKVFKSLGMYSGGNMLFAKVSNNVVSEDKMQLTVLDDTNNTDLEIASPRTGIATSFRIPPYRSGGIESFTVKGKAIGNPADMICYLIDESNMSKFANLEMVNENDSDPSKDEIIIARSKPVKYSDVFERVSDDPSSQDYNTMFIEFDFRDPVTGKFPIVKTSRANATEENRRHCFVVFCESASESNKWQLVMSSGSTDDDYDTTKVSYRFEEINRTVASNNEIMGVENKAFSEIANLDLNFILKTRKLKEKEVSPYRCGLYSSKIKMSGPRGKSTARLSMRILREGLFRIAADSEGILSGSHNLNIDRETSGTRTAMTLGQPLVIGRNAVTCSSSSATSVSFETDAGDIIEVSKRDKVYRNGYSVQLKAEKYSYSPISNSTGRFQKSVVERKYIEMPLKEIAKDWPLQLDEKYSDRLIFECETDGLEKYDEFELQIAWNTPLEIEDIKSEHDFSGGISELAFSLGNTIYSDFEF